MVVKCRSCGGTYAPIQRDGSTYNHVCPPILTVLVTRGGREQRIDLADLLATDLVTVDRNGARVLVPVSAVEKGDVRLGDFPRVRPNTRNENPDPAKLARATATSARDETIVSPGLGVDELGEIDPRSARGPV